MDERRTAPAGGPRGGGGHVLPPRPATRSLVLWSGGLDSTYTLLRVLLESGDAVFSHHVVLDDDSPQSTPCRRTRLEGQAIEALHRRIAARARGFRHTASRVDAGLAVPGADAPLLAFVAARAALSLGFTPFDRILVGVNADRDPGWHPDSAACALRRARMSRAIRAAYGCDEIPQIHLWEPRPTREQMLEYLGAEIASLTVSCLRPVADAGQGLRPCGRCARCTADAPRDGGAPPGGPTAAPAGAAAHTPPLFRRLVESQSRRQEPPDADAASGRPAP